jgi:hypothetical protein
MATVTKIDQHVSANGWADGCEMDGVDEVASFEAYLDDLEEAYRHAYPGAEVVVESRPGDLSNTLRLYDGDQWIDPNDDEQRCAEDIAYEVWQNGSFWRTTGDVA